MSQSNFLGRSSCCKNKGVLERRAAFAFTITMVFENNLLGRRNFFWRLDWHYKIMSEWFRIVLRYFHLKVAIGCY